jgi:acetyl esterase/lipase
MSRFRIPLLTLAFLVVMTASIPTTGGAQEATPAATPAPKPQRPTQPTTGPGSSESLFGGVTAIKQGPPDQFFADSWLFVPSDPLPGTLRAEEPFPLVIVLHGSGASDADAYLAWIEHLVRRGAVVIFPLYERGTSTGYEGYGRNLQDDVRGGLETLEREGVPVDLTRVAVVGHSLGAEQAVVYAASAAAAGLPVPTAVMSIVPWCQSAEGACLGVDLGAIPASTRLLLVTEAEDPSSTAAVARIWGELGGVPLDNRDVVTLVTDVHGRPALLATHTQAQADYDYDRPDAFDWYGTWKWLDALMSCAFDGEGCEYALGNTPEQRFMGEWSDGVPVTEALVTDDPT